MKILFLALVVATSFAQQACVPAGNECIHGKCCAGLFCLETVPPSGIPTCRDSAPASSSSVFRCRSDHDCELLGSCVNGRCSCDAGWGGPSCSTLKLKPLDTANGILWPKHAAEGGKAYIEALLHGELPDKTLPWSWGASVFQNPNDRRVHVIAESGCYNYSSPWHCRGVQLVHLQGAEGEPFPTPLSFADISLPQTRINPHVIQLRDGRFAMAFVGFTKNTGQSCTGTEGSGLGVEDPPVVPGQCQNFNCYLRSCQKSRLACENATGFPEWGNPCQWRNGKCLFPPWKTIFGLRVAVAHSPAGPWNESDVKIQGGDGLNQETNPTLLELDDGRILLGYRFSEPLDPQLGFAGGVKEVLGLAIAQQWGAPWNKVGNARDGLFEHQAEDPFLFLDEHRRGIHMLAHDIVRLNAETGDGWVGSHFFSPGMSGESWRVPPQYPDNTSHCRGYGPGAYSTNVTWSDGTVMTFFRRERPELVMNRRGQPSHLVTGVQLFAQAPGKPGNNQLSFAIVQEVDLEPDRA